MPTEEPSSGERKVSTKVAWLFLLAAGCVEVARAMSIEPTKGFTRFWPTVLCFVLGVGAVYLLTFALRTLPIGTAYAIFTGIGRGRHRGFGHPGLGRPGHRRQARTDRADRRGRR